MAALAVRDMHAKKVTVAVDKKFIFRHFVVACDRERIMDKELYSPSKGCVLRSRLHDPLSYNDRERHTHMRAIHVIL